MESVDLFFGGIGFAAVCVGLSQLIYRVGELVYAFKYNKR